jgi:dolichyl-phosphate-mannose--protein O-mannosyl transferase
MLAEHQPAPPPEEHPRQARNQRLERLRARLLGIRATDRLWGWVGPLVIAALGGFLRFWHLGRPHQLVFDETYYVKQGYTIWQYGIERANMPNLKTPDDLFTRSTPDVFTTYGDSVVHPPVGKWMIGFGEWLFGIDNSNGWRFSSAVVGTLAILMIGRIARRLLGSTLLGCVAALLLAVDGEEFVHSRTGLLDIFVMFWALAAFGLILIDRDRVRAKLAAKVAVIDDAAARTSRPSGFGPGLGLRPYRLLAGVCLGLCCGTKWSGVYFLAVFAFMSLLWDLGARRAVGVRDWARAGILRDGITGFLSTVPVAFAVYLASWAGWFHSTNGYDRQWGAQHPSTDARFMPDSLRSLWHYHQWMYQFHTHLDSFHQYRANPWSWLIQGRPTSFFYESPKKGQDGCTVAQCSKAITSLGTPTIWWGATLALLVLFFMWALRRDWRAGAILAGLLAGYVPWFQYEHRTIFTFYSVAFVPWVVLAVTYVLGMALGPPTASYRRRLWGGTAVGAYLVLTVLLFFFYWPIYTAQVISYADWLRRMWFPSWI